MGLASVSPAASAPGQVDVLQNTLQMVVLQLWVRYNANLFEYTVKEMQLGNSCSDQDVSYTPVDDAPAWTVVNCGALGFRAQRRSNSAVRITFKVPLIVVGFSDLSLQNGLPHRYFYPAPATVGDIDVGVAEVCPRRRRGVFQRRLDLRGGR